MSAGFHEIATVLWTVLKYKMAKALRELLRTSSTKPSVKEEPNSAPVEWKTARVVL